MPVLADNIVIDVFSGQIYIDGKPFGYAVDKNDIEVICRDDFIPAVRITLLANKTVTVADLKECDGAQEE